MALLITLFLVLINIFNNITTNSPKAEGLTAIEIWMLACILFVFGNSLEYTFRLSFLKCLKICTSIAVSNYEPISCNIAQTNPTKNKTVFHGFFHYREKRVCYCQKGVFLHHFYITA